MCYYTLKMIVLPSFSRHKLKLLSKCCIFKVCQFISNLWNFPGICGDNVKVKAWHICLAFPEGSWLQPWLQTTAAEGAMSLWPFLHISRQCCQLSHLLVYFLGL